jgi:uncharacterized protein
MPMKRLLIAALLLPAPWLTGCGERSAPADDVAVAAADSSATAGDFEERSWDDLIPADWDPMRLFEGIDLDSLDDADPRAMEALERLQDEWDNAPANPAMNGIAIRIPGFVVPLEHADTQLREMLLVPYFGACIHSPPPPSNQIIHVTLDTPAAGIEAMDTVWVNGVIETVHSSTGMGDASYRMRAVQVEAYE